MRYAKLVCFLVIGVMSGCQEKSAQRGDFFADQGTLTRGILDSQAARGAAADATLYTWHFDGQSLSAAGRMKLDRMLEHKDSISPLTIYLDVPADAALTQARFAAITAYLSDAGLAKSQMKLQSGPNPATLHYVDSDANALKPPPERSSPDATISISPGTSTSSRQR